MVSDENGGKGCLPKGKISHFIFPWVCNRIGAELSRVILGELSHCLNTFTHVIFRQWDTLIACYFSSESKYYCEYIEKEGYRLWGLLCKNLVGPLLPQRDHIKHVANKVISEVENGNKSSSLFRQWVNRPICYSIWQRKLA